MKVIGMCSVQIHYPTLYQFLTQEWKFRAGILQTNNDCPEGSVLIDGECSERVISQGLLVFNKIVIFK